MSKVLRDVRSCANELLSAGRWGLFEMVMGPFSRISGAIAELMTLVVISSLPPPPNHDFRIYDDTLSDPCLRTDIT